MQAMQAMQPEGHAAMTVGVKTARDAFTVRIDEVGPQVTRLGRSTAGEGSSKTGTAGYRNHTNPLPQNPHPSL
jgi:hypothetical protein